MANTRARRGKPFDAADDLCLPLSLLISSHGHSASSTALAISSRRDSAHFSSNGHRARVRNEPGATRLAIIALLWSVKQRGGSGFLRSIGRPLFVLSHDTSVRPSIRQSSRSVAAGNLIARRGPYGPRTTDRPLCQGFIGCSRIAAARPAIGGRRGAKKICLGRNRPFPRPPFPPPSPLSLSHRVPAWEEKRQPGPGELPGWKKRRISPIKRRHGQR